MIQNKGKYVILQENSTKDKFVFVFSVKDVLSMAAVTGIVVGLLWLFTGDGFLVFQYGLYTLIITGILRFEIPEIGLMVQSILIKELKYRLGTRHYKFRETQKFKE